MTESLLILVVFGRTQVGNNSAYCRDNELSWYNWRETDDDFLRWCQRVVALCGERSVFHRRRWFQGRRIRGIGDLAWFRPDGEE